ncbi:4-hydroxythreonine-4-phosphate dehydrogenase PdxA [Chryseobacterium indologenes]|uniref:4-hydroxythreonine-4-phosphate dehydrogenase PdxA n=1 Tax=Chryseobacterium indologenes TaxID=253 RepID=A0AAD1DVW7_CHRID|nr:4-hydroxythreonine-4-phosphate dehydrogenase PdxA [Chryseobacterium indologenes]ASE62894.1 4-hydroxythreonine-4-phosphate dehydrogenase PdxA [Chryseobacterium indologenes]ATN06811.1 4-hydroxythreonine-4-phosphate dehydrogenase PdxA [Chryseobacterium indologenes]AYY84443.1 4-hydroxythreonine-4-phosphate dehydrogenase PdxA [Chryseobacterium indologenes]AYZ34200.1 4-hydroxythreonine-4-phosphate dehydrogenase PdxA [Chryseobacterium indologenes]AZB18599.1 4-hydroxythreonine-4-phosphate dehydroge
MSPKNHKVRVGISIGDFNGIGPEIIMKSLKDKTITDFFTPVIFGSGKLFTYQKNIFKLNLNFNYVNEASQAQAGKLNMVNLTKENVNVELGVPTEESTKMAIDSLEAATEALIKGDIDVLVTAPINKDEMVKMGFKHAGHTGYFEEKFNKKGLMFLVTEELKVAVSTHHIPIAQVAENISKEKIKKQIRVLNQTLIEDFCIQKPKIAVLGLNPHAGDGGVIGNEEIEIISPAIKELSDNGILTFGPFPADSFFQPGKYKNFDAVLAMYHDQGLAPFKTLAYEEGVNYTAGLPFIRTSPDHGVAYDIAGKNIADEQSFTEAIFTAIKVFRNRSEYNDLMTNRLQPRKMAVDNGIDEDLPEETEA